tara:strand:+ start:297 stop:788 length:492 start_codon:yes stop_codon:yes gene_type:complete
MNFKRFSITALQVVGLGLLPTAVLADVNQTTKFKGAVPGSCSYVSGQNQQNVALTYASENNGTLSGTSADITISCNFATKLTLGKVTPKEGGNPATTTDTASLFVGSNSSALMTSSNSAASEATDANNTPNQDFTVKIGLNSTGATKVGDYEYTVMLTTLSNS